MLDLIAMWQLWRVLAVLQLCLVLRAGPTQVTDAAVRWQLRWVRTMSASLPGPAPMGWKLEPRLNRFLRTATVFYVRLWQELVWRPLFVALQLPYAA